MTLHSIVGSSLCDLCGEQLMDEKVRDGDPPSQLLRRAKGHHRQVAAATAPQYFAVRWTPGQLSAARRRSEIAATIERYRSHWLLYVIHV